MIMLEVVTKFKLFQ